MTIFNEFLRLFGPLISVIVIAVAFIWASHRIASRLSSNSQQEFKWQLLDLAIIATAMVCIVVALPLSDETQGQVLSLLGVVLTGVIGLSSTTFVSNSIAGIMLQISSPFRPGDYIQIGEQFGRVISISLVQTRIQTETRDMATLPNLLLLNNPVTVTHREGTILSAEVSLGYDIHHAQIEPLLESAAVDAGLEEPWVSVQDLLDHSVLYRINGMLPDTKNMLSTRSKLRRCILDQLHGAGLEIVSPAFMNQRQLDPTVNVSPALRRTHAPRNTDETAAPEELIFDAAEEAAALEEVKQKLLRLKQQIKTNQQTLKESTDKAQQELLQRKAARLESIQSHYQQLLDTMADK